MIALLPVRADQLDMAEVPAALPSGAEVRILMLA